MIRRPLRPIARVLKARETGVDPNLIEAEEKAARMHGQRNAERFRAQSRLVLLAVLVLVIQTANLRLKADGALWCSHVPACPGIIALCFRR